MKRKQKMSLLASLGFPVIALAAVMGTQAPVQAFANCFYMGDEFSPGACIHSICESEKWQICQDDGTWVPECRSCAG